MNYPVKCEMWDIDEDDKSSLKNKWNNRLRPQNMLILWLYQKVYDKSHMKSVSTQTDIYDKPHMKSVSTQTDN